MMVRMSRRQHAAGFIEKVEHAFKIDGRSTFSLSLATLKGGND
jgi:hypothetical protein